MIRKLILLAAAGAVLAGGYVLAFYEVPPLYKIVGKVDRKTREILFPQAAEEAGSTFFRETTFLNLLGQVVEIPRESWLSGGALEPWSDEELAAIVREGTIFAITREGEIAAAPIVPPETGFEAYVAAVEARGLRRRDHDFRFNDMLVRDDGGRRHVYLSATFYNSERECYGTRLFKTEVAPDARLADTKIAEDDWEIFFETSPCMPLNEEWVAIDGLGAGGRMTLGPSGEIYLSSGDYALDGIVSSTEMITDPDSDYGKILAIDPETGEKRMISTGHRNPGGITFDTEGRLWTVEHAMRGGDELNLIEEGNDYGWPRVSLGTLYSGSEIPSLEEQGSHEGYTPPVYAWLPSIGIDTLTLIENFDPRWDGDLLAGSLASPAYGRLLLRIRVEGERVRFIERIDGGDRIRHVTMWGDMIAMMNDSNQVVLMEKSNRVDHTAAMTATLTDEFGAEATEEVATIIEDCSTCHSFNSPAHGTGPSLQGVLGREVAATSFEGYSEDLRAAGGAWDGERIIAFARNPQSVAPESAMPPQSIPEGAEPALVRALEVFESVDERGVGYD